MFSYMPMSMLVLDSLFGTVLLQVYFNLQFSLSKHHRPCEFSGTPSPCANAHCEQLHFPLKLPAMLGVNQCLPSARPRPCRSLGIHLFGFLLPAIHDLGGTGCLLMLDLTLLTRVPRVSVVRTLLLLNVWSLMCVLRSSCSYVKRQRNWAPFQTLLVICLRMVHSF